MTLRHPHPLAAPNRRRAAALAAGLMMIAAAIPTHGLALNMGDGSEHPSAALRAAEKTGPETRRLRAAPPPAEKPARPLAGSLSVLNPLTGATTHLAVRPFGRRAVEVRQSNGCVWRRDDWFAPSIFWRNCGESRNWRDGSSENTGGEGLWPLRVGAEGRFMRRALSAGGASYERETRCRVRDAVEVLRRGQTPTPAFVVACDDGKRVRTTWWAPGIGPIAFRQVHAKKGLEELWVAQ